MYVVLDYCENITINHIIKGGVTRSEGSGVSKYSAVYYLPHRASKTCCYRSDDQSAGAWRVHGPNDLAPVHTNIIFF